MPLTQLIYMSTAIENDDATIEKILESARRRNFANGITGMLLICDNNIIQVLEGRLVAVEDTFNRIRLDNRHTGIHKFPDLQVVDRDFGEWSMGFRRFSRNDLDTKEELSYFFRLTPAEINSRVKPGLARSLLRSMCRE